MQPEERIKSAAASELDLVSAQNLAPDLDSRFQIFEELGSGGSSRVFRAMETLLEREVALKILFDRADANDEASIREKRFQQEARATSLLRHENIVEVFSFGCLKDRRYFICMEFLKGKTLEELLKSGRKLEQEEFGKVFLPVCDALIHAHTNKIIHRDIKPANIILVRSDSTAAEDADIMADAKSKVKVLDFGISKLINENMVQTLTQIGAPIGSSPYMSPEQCANKAVSFQSDIYSLACVMYEVLAGKPPFCGSTPAETMYAQINNPVPPLIEISAARRIPKALLATIMKALSKDPAQRQSSMQAFKSEIANSLEKTNYASKGNSTGKLLVVSLIAIVAMAGTFFYYYWKSNLKPAESVDLAENIRSAKADSRNKNSLRYAPNEESIRSYLSRCESNGALGLASPMALDAAWNYYTYCTQPNSKKRALGMDQLQKSLNAVHKRINGGNTGLIPSFNFIDEVANSGFRKDTIAIVEEFQKTGQSEQDTEYSREILANKIKDWQEKDAEEPSIPVEHHKIVEQLVGESEEESVANLASDFRKLIDGEKTNANSLLLESALMANAFMRSNIKTRPQIDELAERAKNLIMQMKNCNRDQIIAIYTYAYYSKVHYRYADAKALFEKVMKEAKRKPDLGYLVRACKKQLETKEMIELKRS